MQPDALPDLFDHELAIALVIGRGERLRAPGDLDRVGVVDADALQKLPESRVEAIVEAPDDRRRRTDTSRAGHRNGTAFASAHPPPALTSFNFAREHRSANAHSSVIGAGGRTYPRRTDKSSLMAAPGFFDSAEALFRKMSLSHELKNV